MAAQVYQRFVSIHPFEEGNGRTSRLLMDWVLQRAGYPPLIFEEGSSGGIEATHHFAIAIGNDFLGRMHLLPTTETAAKKITDAAEYTHRWIEGKMKELKSRALLQ